MSCSGGECVCVSCALIDANTVVQCCSMFIVRFSYTKHSWLLSSDSILIIISRSIHINAPFIIFLLSIFFVNIASIQWCERTNTHEKTLQLIRKTCVCFIILITHSIWCGCNLQQPKPPLTANFRVRKWVKWKFPNSIPLPQSMVSNLHDAKHTNVCTYVNCMLTSTFGLLSFGWPNIFISWLSISIQHHNYTISNQKLRETKAEHVSFIHSIVK